MEQTFKEYNTGQDIQKGEEGYRYTLTSIYIWLAVSRQMERTFKD